NLAFAKLEAHPCQPDLLKEVQIVVCDAIGIEAVAQLDVARIGLVDRFRLCLSESGHSQSPDRGMEESPALHVPDVIAAGGNRQASIDRQLFEHLDPLACQPRLPAFGSDRPIT